VVVEAVSSWMAIRGDGKLCELAFPAACDPSGSPTFASTGSCSSSGSAGGLAATAFTGSVIVAYNLPRSGNARADRVEGNRKRTEDGGYSHEEQSRSRNLQTTDVVGVDHVYNESRYTQGRKKRRI
jgi:hypothetical protein